MKILIIDDEPLARMRLRSIIAEIDAGEVVGEGASGKDALSLCGEFKPDIILLDIRMPGMDGIEAAQHIMKLDTPPAIIFTTAYDEYAVTAFESHAVDYLMKPVRKERLQEALQSATRMTRAQMQALKDDPVSDRRQHISARLGGELRLIPVDEICYFMAEHKYVTVKHRQGTVLIEESLRTLEKEFEDIFLRVHRNALVAVACISALEKDRAGGHKIKMRGIEDTLEVSRRHLPTVRKAMKTL